MSIGERADKILGYVFHGLEWIVRILLLGMTLLVAAQVFLRGLFNTSIKWAEEVTLIGMIYVTFLALAVGIRHDIHLRIEMFMQWLPRRGRIILEFADNLLLFFVSAMMLFYGTRLMIYGKASTMPATHLPTSVIYFAAPFAGLLCCLHLLLRLTNVSQSRVADGFIQGAKK